MMSRDARHPAPGFDTPANPAAPALRERLLRVPLFWKLLLAHMGVVALAVVAALWLATRYAADHPSWMVATLAVAAGLVLSGLVTAVVLRFALAPLEQLEEAASRALAGDAAEFRVTVHPAADEELRDVVDLFNALLGRAAEHRRQLGELTARALGSAEAERRRVGLLLQDEVAQQLASLLVQLRLLDRASDREARDRAREELRSSLVATLEGVRRTARALRPPELEELGLDKALTALLRETGEDGGCEVTSEIEPIDHVLSGPSSLALFRILQEALLAARRTEPPCRIGVRLFRRGDEAVGEVSTAGNDSPVLEAWLEDGEGAPELGLFGMRERARFVGGSVSVERRGEDGLTVVRATVPIE